ncbi:hypothetical protein [Nocardioides astragali]|uniref:Uncharacterized protein n=1 Tax=Nocardioides astragali TaxID=1776736 RepID=A0ABW2N1Y9_9ACTN|nr:hypothetical protein [Nocardioides astragali]
MSPSHHAATLAADDIDRYDPPTNTRIDTWARGELEPDSSWQLQAAALCHDTDQDLGWNERGLDGQTTSTPRRPRPPATSAEGEPGGPGTGR